MDGAWIGRLMGRSTRRNSPTMLSATTTLPTLDLPHAAGHVRAALERADVKDISLTKTSKGFRARGIRGGTGTAVFGGLLPTSLIGWLSRSGIEVLCYPSRNEGDETLHVTVRVRGLREFDDEEEANWVTRGPGEILGDKLQTRRILRKVMTSIDESSDAGPEGYGIEKGMKTKQRREQFQERYRRGKRRRNIQMAVGFALAGLVLVLRRWLNG